VPSLALVILSTLGISFALVVMPASSFDQDISSRFRQSVAVVGEGLKIWHGASAFSRVIAIACFAETLLTAEVSTRTREAGSRKAHCGATRLRRRKEDETKLEEVGVT
jgi:hypothetical protein